MEEHLGQNLSDLNRAAVDKPLVAHEEEILKGILRGILIGGEGGGLSIDLNINRLHLR